MFRLPHLACFLMVGAFLLVGCGEPDAEERDYTPDEFDEDDVGGQQDGRMDDASGTNCNLEDVSFQAGETTYITEGSDGCSRHLIPPFTIDRPVEIDVQGTVEVVDEDGVSHSSLIGICLLPWDYTRLFGGPSQPSDRIEDGWQLDDGSGAMSESPCGHFAPLEDGTLEPAGDSPPFEDYDFAPGVYKLMINLPDTDAGETGSYDLQFDLNDLGGPVCGDGKIESDATHEEECDDGDQSPFSPCSASCELQKAMNSPGNIDESYDEPADAFDLEGFRNIRWIDTLRPGADPDYRDASDWFQLEIPEDASTTEFKATRHDHSDSLGNDVVLSLYEDEHGSEPVATDFGEKAFEQLEAGDYLLEVTPTEATEDEELSVWYGFRLKIR